MDTFLALLNPEIMLGGSALAVLYLLGTRALSIADRAVDVLDRNGRNCAACKEHRDA